MADTASQRTAVRRWWSPQYIYTEWAEGRKFGYSKIAAAQPGLV